MEGSEAERLLKLDMDKDKHKWMQPKEVYLSQAEYCYEELLRTQTGEGEEEIVDSCLLQISGDGTKM
jgi:hypothetical protein